MNYLRFWARAGLEADLVLRVAALFAAGRRTAAAFGLAAARDGVADARRADPFAFGRDAAAVRAVAAGRAAAGRAAAGRAGAAAARDAGAAGRAAGFTALGRASLTGAAFTSFPSSD